MMRRQQAAHRLGNGRGPAGTGNAPAQHTDQQHGQHGIEHIHQHCSTIT
jgi:hypothetical protein